MQNIDAGPFVPFRVGLGALGASPLTAVGATAATYGAQAGTSALSTALGAGALAGPVGLAVGAIVGLVAGKLLTKNYANVAAMNADQASEVSVFNQYRAIAGRAPGRQYGLPAMRAVWKGALWSGLFPINNTHLCFHEGCVTYAGQPSEIDNVLDDNCGDQNCFNNLYPRWLAWRQGANNVTVAAPGVTGGAPQYQVFTPPRMAVTSRLRGLGDPDNQPGRLPRIHPYYAAKRRMMLAGLGLLGTVSQPVAPDAVSFIDQFFIPANAPGSPCTGGAGCYWAYPQTDLAHQLLYDVADAWLAQKPIATTPYVAVSPSLPATPAQQATPPAAVIPAASSTTVCQPYPPGVPVPAIACATQGPCYPCGQCGPCQQALAVVQGPAYINPQATPLLPATPPAAAIAAGAVTGPLMATNANLDGYMASQGYNRVGTTPDGFPLYSQGGQVYAYQNGNLFSVGSVAQLAATGGAGTGIATPTTGLDPTTAALIANAIQQGMTQQQAAQVGAQYLQAQGVPVTPTVDAQLQGAAASPAAGAGISSGTLLLLGGGALLVLMSGRRRAAA